MLGFMGVTAFLSMWISNTATTAMMVPIVQAILDQLNSNMDSEAPSKSQRRSVIQPLDPAGPNILKNGTIDVLCSLLEPCRSSCFRDPVHGLGQVFLFFTNMWSNLLNFHLLS